MMSDDRENTGPWLARSKSIMVSGGFDPIHPGHVRLIESAAKLGDVIVALNSDAWLERKKGFCFQGWDERAEVLMAMRNVSKVVPVNDADGTVCAALREYSPDYFANGGDRNTVNTPELSLCAELNIQPLFGIGGDIKKY
jgi:D-beta-D-heptose 7-phosphate kinase/D-beta-D-heptose 1-phosphate adenosyltransferase